jgi:phosphopantetheinyl transferase
VQNISSLAIYSAAYGVVLTEHPIASRIISNWATEPDCLHARSRRLGDRGALLARAALRSLLYAWSGSDVWEFQNDARGKLSATSADGEAGPYVSLAHTRGAVGVAVARGAAIGIDLERHRQRDFGRIAEYGFGPREQLRIDQQGMPEFYRIWTVREAIAKATGQGLALVTDGLDRVQSGPPVGFWTTRCDGEDWLLHHSRPATDLSLAIAVAAPAKHEIARVSAEELARSRNAV